MSDQVKRAWGTREFLIKTIHFIMNFELKNFLYQNKWWLFYIPVSPETEGEFLRGRWGRGVAFFTSVVVELGIIKEERPTVCRAESISI